MKSNLIVYLLLICVGIALLHEIASLTFSQYSQVLTAIGAKLMEVTQ